MKRSTLAWIIWGLTVTGYVAYQDITRFGCTLCPAAISNEIDAHQARERESIYQSRPEASD